MLASVAAGLPHTAAAGPYADEMAKCFVRETTPADRTLFIRWMFSAMALHPEVKTMSNVTDAQRVEASKGTAGVFERLLLESCRKEAKQSVRYEGAQTLAGAFELLGQVAARELFTNKEVAGGLATLSKYFDEKKIKALAEEATSEAGAPAAAPKGEVPTPVK